MTEDELKLVFDALKQCNTYAFAGGLGVRATAHRDALAILEKALAQRTWLGLTDEEISELIRATHNTGSFVCAIEAKLKEKNT
jgi:hypothetical protein